MLFVFVVGCLWVFLFMLLLLFFVVVFLGGLFF